MTINVPIRPGAALSDPATRAFVEEHLLNAHYNVVIRHSWVPDRVYNKEGIVNILANFPWREYGYKWGRWRRKPVIDELPFIPWYDWYEVHETLLLTDPRSGREVNEVNGIVIKAQKPAGRLFFAGDPHYAGVVNTVVDGERHMYIVGSVRLAGLNDTKTSELARDLSKVMVPEHPPQANLLTLAQAYLDTLGPWLADHPEKPPKPKKR
jgi:hypothetical protein